MDSNQSVRADAPAHDPDHPHASFISAEQKAATPDEDESLIEEIGALIDDGRNYAQAEIAFQKTRAALASRSVGIALVCGIVALILVNIATLALAVGLVMALEPVFGIWGAIVAVVGGLALLIVILVLIAAYHGKKLGRIFGSAGDDDQAGAN